VIRISTERPEAVEAGFARVVGVKKEKILEAMDQTLKEKGELPSLSPYGDGSAGKGIVKIIIEEAF